MRRGLRRSAAGAALVYVVLGTIWILVSDSLVEALPRALNLRLQTMKGFLFVAVTGVAFYAMARGWSLYLSAVEARLLKATEEALEARGLADMAMQAAPDGVILTDPDGVVRFWSESATRIFGWSVDEVIGRPLRVVPEEQRAEFDAVRERVLAGEIVSAIEVTRRRKDGSSVDVSLSTALVRDASGGIRGIMAFIRDITERKARERELDEYRNRLEALVDQRTAELSQVNARLVEASRAKSDFMAAMSHELRTPLNAIIGFSQLLRREMAGPINEEQERQLSIVVDAAGNLLELINGILDLARIEAGKELVAPADFVLGDVVGSVLDTLSPLADDSGLSMTVRISDPDAVIHSDAGKVRQVLMNLVANAIKFTEQGSVDVAVSVGRDTVRFDVEDTGPGIPEDQLPHVTEDFFRAQYPDPTRSPGTGLGLSISKRLAVMLGGRLEAHSTLGRGSVFSLVIPVRLANDEEVTADE